MRYSVIFALLIMLGCDSGAIQRDGNDLTVINQTTVDWLLTRSDTDDTWNITGDSKRIFLRCYESSGCESTFLAKPAISPPDGCGGWEKDVRTVRIPNDYHRTTQWRLDEYDLQPLPRGCVGKNTLAKVRAQFAKK